MFAKKIVLLIAKIKDRCAKNLELSPPGFFTVCFQGKKLFSVRL